MRPDLAKLQSYILPLPTPPPPPSCGQGELGLVQSNKICLLQIVILAGLGSRKVWIPRAPAREEEAAERSQCADQVSDLRLLASARRGWGDSSDSWWVHCQPVLATLLSAPPTDLSSKPGARAVRPLHHRQHLLRPAYRALRDGGGGCAEGQCPRLHHGAAGRVQHRYYEMPVSWGF